MNRLTRCILSAGTALAVIVPLTGSSVDAAPSRSADDTTVTVRSGDSLIGIARRNGVNVSALLRANSITLTSMIHPGDRLILPTAGSTSNSTGRPSAAAHTVTSSSSATTYVVKAGDALSTIAWRHGVGLSALLRANDLSVDSLILPGRRLQVPAATRTTTMASSSSAGAPGSPASPSRAGDEGALDTLLDYLVEQVGAPYRFFSAGPDAFDCSGLVVAGFREIGIRVPHQSRALAKLGSAIDWRNEPIRPGDLVFTSSVGDPDYITHVGVALDGKRWVHAVGRGRTVSIGTLPSSEKIMAVQRLDLT